MVEQGLTLVLQQHTALLCVIINNYWFGSEKLLGLGLAWLDSLYYMALYQFLVLMFRVGLHLLCLGLVWVVILHFACVLSADIVRRNTPQ